MRIFALVLLVSGCVASRPLLAEPVEFQASLQAGTVEAGAMQGVGGTLINHSSQSIYNYGRGGIGAVRLIRQSQRPFRRADALADTSTVIGPYWERAYHLAFAPDPGASQRLDQPFTIIKPGGRLILDPVRFAWPRDPGVYWVSVCSGFAPAEERGGREVCAPAVQVTIEAPRAGDS